MDRAGKHALGGTPVIALRAVIRGADLWEAFREDADETAAGHAGANAGLVRRVAASLLEQDPSKGALRRSS